jgi:flagellin
MGNFSGSFYDNILRVVETTEYVYYPYSYSGTSNAANEQVSYIVGRKDISGGVEINPFVNDMIVFDLSHNGNIIDNVSLQITAEHYTPQGLVQEINSQLDSQEL